MTLGCEHGVSAEITVGLVQQTCQGNPEDNLRASIIGVRRAAEEGADLVLLSELHRFPYFCQTADYRNFTLAESIPGPTCDVLGRLARELAVVIIGSVFERRTSGIYHNTAVVLDRNGTLAGRYRKMHLPDEPGYHEKFYFSPGDLGFKPIATQLGKIGVLICWDQWFPEAARLMALQGAELLVYPTAIGWNPKDDQDTQIEELDAWTTIHKAHAIANGIPVLACNRTGHEVTDNGPGIRFWGSSLILGPMGQIIGQSTMEASEVLTASINLRSGESTRQIWPYLRDRRIDEYSGLLRRFID